MGCWNGKGTSGSREYPRNRGPEIDAGRDELGWGAVGAPLGWDVVGRRGRPAEVPWALSRMQNHQEKNRDKISRVRGMLE